MTNARRSGAADAVRVHTQRCARPEAAAPTFVLVHGMGASHAYFRRLQVELARTGEVHAVDLPGFGGLPRPDGPLSIAQLAGALGDRLESLGVGPAVLVGHSMGAQVVAELALSRPDLVSHLVLVGPVADPERATAVTQGRDLVRDMLKEPVSANALVIGAYLRCGIRWYVTELPAVLAYPTLDAVSRTRCPVLVLRGADDPIARAGWVRRLADAAPDGRLVEVRGARHVVQHSAPREVAAAIVAHAARGRGAARRVGGH